MIDPERKEKLRIVADLAYELGLDDIGDMLATTEMPALSKADMDGTGNNGIATRLRIVREHFRAYWSKW